ncbi:MAG: sel1 repeat family protein [Bacteroidaceae bacterium]|nr:sel1 repeat family protein [Bacteroidaceae bacterium]
MTNSEELAKIKVLADAGDASAQWRYAMIRGAETSRNVDEILYYLRESAAQDNKYGQYFLAYFLAFGDGCERNIELAESLCRKAAENGHEPAERLMYEIDRYQFLLQEYDIEVEYPYPILFQALYNHDVELLIPHLADDVVLIDVLREPLYGKPEVVSYLKQRFSVDKDANMRPNYYPSQRYGNIIELYVPNRRRLVLIAKVNDDGKIDRIAYQPLVWEDVFNGLFSSCCNSPLDLDNLESDENGYHKGHMFCGTCGCLSHELNWFKFESSNVGTKHAKYKGRVSICPKCGDVVECIIEGYEKQSVESNLIETLQALKDTIAENIQINRLEDFNIIDASFVLNALSSLKLEEGKTLGIYRHGYLGGTRDFYSVPYVHDTDASLEFVPQKKKQGFFQRLFSPAENSSARVEYFSDDEYSSNMLIYDVIHEVATKSIPTPSKHIIMPWNEQAVWEAFLLDNLKYLLPSMGHGNYERRKFICSYEDVEQLPVNIVGDIKRQKVDIRPKIDIVGNNANITCFSFNKWSGLEKWEYTYIASGSDSGKVKVALGKNMRIIIIPYTSSTRY